MSSREQHITAIAVRSGEPPADAGRNRPSSIERVTWRAILIALLIIPINSRWINEIENVRNYMWPSMFSLPLNVLAILMLITFANLAIKKFLPRWALSQSELLVIYSMLAVSSVIAGWSFVSRVMGWIATPVYRATAENRWSDLFGRYLPVWLVPSDPTALQYFYEGRSSFWQPANLAAWIIPLLVWVLFLLAFMGVMACMSVIVRRRWLDEERLTFPVVHLPFELTRPDKALIRQSGFWVGVSISVSIALLGGLNRVFPDLPTLPTPLFEIGASMLDPPWSSFRGFGNLPVRFYPWVIGFGMLMPKEVLFSYWFFFWILRFQALIGAAHGLDMSGDSILLRKEVGGAMLAIAPAILWGSRNYLRGIWQQVVRGQKKLDGTAEPFTYRAAFIGLILCGAIMLWIACSAGMSLWLALLFLGIYFIMTLSVTRARAEIGGPANEVGIMQPDGLIVGALGPGVLAARNLTVLSLFSWTGAAYGQDPVPHQVESLKLAQLARFDSRRLFLGIMLASFIGVLAAFITLLMPLYHIGAATAHSSWDGIDQATGFSYSQLQNWVASGGSPDRIGIYGTTFLVSGFAFSLLLFILHGRFLWWPFHPLGFVMAGNYYTYFFWPSLFLAWLSKTLILRYGGKKAFTSFLPFFLGLIAGDALMGSIWSVVSMIWEVSAYSVWI